MKRFYTEAGVTWTNSGYAVTLDNRPVRTPMRAQLMLPNSGLAKAIADEWMSQGETIDPASMPITGLANAAIDQVAPDTGAFAAAISAYGESDLLCYRAGDPPELAARQEAEWQPLLDWAARRFDTGFAVTSGIIHVAQADTTLARLRSAVAAYDPFTMTALSTLVSISGSLVIGLAAVEDAFPLAQLWQAAELDELWQSDQWGDDDEALARRARRNAEFKTAARFAALAQDKTG